MSVCLSDCSHISSLVVKTNNGKTKTKTGKQNIKQIHIAHNNTRLLYSSQSALNLLKFIKITVVVIDLRKKDYNFTTHTC